MEAPLLRVEVYAVEGTTPSLEKPGELQGFLVAALGYLHKVVRYPDGIWCLRRYQPHSEHEVLVSLHLVGYAKGSYSMPLHLLIRQATLVINQGRLLFP